MKKGNGKMFGKCTKTIALMLSAVMLVAGLASCGAKGSAGEDTGKEKNDDAWAEELNIIETKSIKSMMTETSFDEKLLSFVSEHTSGNYMVSPLSFRYALGLLLAGAEGETKAELLKAFGVESEEEWIAFCLDFNGFVEHFAEGLERDIERFKSDKKNGWIPEGTKEPFRALRVANSVWKAERVKEDFKEAYRENIEKNYSAEYRSFTEENAIQRINEWADIKTEHMIPRLLPDNYPTEDLAVVLMNALYFKDSWVNSFEKGLTREGDFYKKDGNTAKKEFMSTSELFSYYEDEETKLVVLPMDGGVYMAFVLGSTKDLSEKLSNAKNEQVKVTIPKLDLETEFACGELVEFLKENGVKLAFDADRADFSGMIDHQIYVSDIIQKTRIKLDEDGVEAAAVTAIMMDNGAAAIPKEPKVFTADRPFSFFIYTTCNDTTAVMFAGEIVE